MQRLKLPKGNLCSPGGAQALRIPGTEGTLQPSAVRAAACAKQSTQKASRVPSIHTGGSPSSGPGMLFLIYEPLTVTFGAVRRDYLFFFFRPVLQFLSAWLRSHWLLTICLSYLPCLVANVQHRVLALCS